MSSDAAQKTEARRRCAHGATLAGRAPTRFGIRRGEETAHPVKYSGGLDRSRAQVKTLPPTFSLSARREHCAATLAYFPECTLYCIDKGKRTRNEHNVGKTGGTAMIRTIAAVIFALLAVTTPAHAMLVDPPPAIGLWIDPTQPVPGNTFFQTWGQVITAPASDSFLQSISLSPRDDVLNPATNFE
jgi:hypothetical protein